MGVCYHFQRGNCRFGASCRYEHVDPNYDSYYHTDNSSQYQGDRYHYVKPSAATSQPAKIEASQIFDVVAADTMVAVHGSQWPFSSYGPVKGYQNIIGLEDISPEELRYLMYSAKESGNVEECKRQFNELLQIENMKRTLLMTPSVEADAAIQSIYRVAEQPPSSLAAPSFQPSRSAAESHSASIFGGSASHPASPFGVVPGNTFSSAPGNAFGSAPGNAFGSAPVGLFAAAAAAVSQPSAGFFGSIAQQPAPGFFAAAQAPPSGLFAAAASGFGQSPSGPGAFNQSPAGAGSFNQSPTVGSSSIFGGAAVAQPNRFAAANHTASIFGAGKQMSAPGPAFGNFETGNEAFGKATAPSGSFQPGSDVSGSLYTPIGELDDEEKAAFQAKTFALGQVPTRPPPREMCV